MKYYVTFYRFIRSKYMWKKKRDFFKPLLRTNKGGTFE